MKIAAAEKSKVSVIIPAYNASRWLAATIESVLGQTLAGLELLLVDDGSNDTTGEIICHYQQLDPRVKGFRKPNGGLSSARNFGVRESRGKYIAFLDADDIWLPEKLAAQVAMLEEDRTPGAVCSQFEEIDASGRIIRDWSELSNVYFQEEINSLLLASGNYVTGSGSSVVIRREIVNEVGEFDTAMKQAEDWDYWYRVSLISRFKLMPKVLVQIRRHTQGMQKNVDVLLQSRVYFAQKALSFAPAEHRKALMQVKTKALFDLFIYYARARKMSPAVKSFSHLAFRYPVEGFEQSISYLYRKIQYHMRSQRVFGS